MSAEQPAEWTRVCAVEALTDSGRKEALIGRTAVLLIWADGQPIACNAHCPHAFAPLFDGVIAEGRIHCARHQASFDLETGAVDAGWRLPPLAIHETRIEGGAIYVRLRGGA